MIVDVLALIDDAPLTLRRPLLPGQQHLPIENDFPQEIGIDAG